MKKTNSPKNRSAQGSKKQSLLWQNPFWQELVEQAPFWIVGGVLLVFFLAMKKIMEPRSLETAETSYSYEMPRAKSDFGIQIFSKNIIRRYFGFGDPTRVATAKAEAHQPTAKVSPAVDPKKDPKAQAKKEDPKKKKDDKKVAKNSKNKKPVVKIAVQEGPDRYSQKLSETQAEAPSEPANYAGAPVEVAPPYVAAPEEEDKLTAQQWRALLFAQPTSANQAKFLAAYRAKDIDESSFYHIATELFSDTASDRQKAGLELLKATPSVKSYTALLNHYQEGTPEPLKTQISDILKSYADVSKFSVLNQLLYSSEARVVSSAQSLLSQAIAKFQAQQTSTSSGRDTRSPGSTTTVKSPAVLKNFLPSLKRLVASNNETIAQQAQAMMDSINALNATTSTTLNASVN